MHRLHGYGRESIAFVADYVLLQQGKKQLKLSCKPKHSGEQAPEHFYEKCGFIRAKTQDPGALDLNCARNAHDRRVKLVMEKSSRACARACV